MRAIVIGAGVGGLAAANALGRAGIEATVYERMPELREVGSGLTLWVNAMRSLDKFAARDAIAARGAEVHRIENRRADGRSYKTLPIEQIGEKYGTPSVSIHRGELQSALAELLPEGTIQVNAECARFDQDDGGVTVYFTDGREERADLLIGTDGIGSTVRRHLFGKPEPRYSGYTCWRSAAHIEHPASSLRSTHSSTAVARTSASFRSARSTGRGTARAWHRGVTAAANGRWCHGASVDPRRRLEGET